MTASAAAIAPEGSWPGSRTLHDGRHTALTRLAEKGQRGLGSIDGSGFVDGHEEA